MSLAAALGRLEVGRYFSLEIGGLPWYSCRLHGIAVKVGTFLISNRVFAHGINR